MIEIDSPAANTWNNKFITFNFLLFYRVLNIVIVIQIDSAFVHISQAYWSSSGMYQTHKI